MAVNITWQICKNPREIGCSTASIYMNFQKFRVVMYALCSNSCVINLEKDWKCWNFKGGTDVSLIMDNSG